MKKMLALAIVAVMMFACTVGAAAAQKSLPDLDGTGWWTAHTEGIEVTEDGVEITCKATAYETAECNWNGPLYVVYTGDEAKVNGAGYTEYWVCRGDAYAWTITANTLDGLETLRAAGYDFSSTGVEGWVGWENFVSALKAGTDCKISAKLADGKVTVVMEACGLQSTSVIPVDSSKPVYLSLSADTATLTNIQVNPDKNSANTGDMIAVAVAAMVVSGMGIALVAKKKEN